MLWIPLAIGAAAGLAKNQSEQANANSERKAQSELTRYSPWTGVHGNSVKNPSMFGNVAQGAAAGAMLGSGMGAAPAGAEAGAGTAASGSGAGSTQFSLGANGATNSAPYTLGASGAAPSAYGSQFGLEGAKGASLASGAGTGSMYDGSPWGGMPAGENMENYMARMKNPYGLK